MGAGSGLVDVSFYTFVCVYRILSSGIAGSEAMNICNDDSQFAVACKSFYHGYPMSGIVPSAFHALTHLSPHNKPMSWVLLLFPFYR